MKISVAMCTYNGDEFLNQQLASIAEQTRLPNELVVSDDGSCDATANLLQEFAARAPFPVHISLCHERLGVAKNFERAIGACGGDIIVLSDQDDVWYANKLELIEAEFLATPEVGLVFSDAELVDVKLIPQRESFFQRIGFDRRKQKRFTRGEALRVLMTQTVVSGATMAFRADLRGVILPIPGAGPLIHDGWIAVMIAAVAAVKPINQPLIKYRQHFRQQMGARTVSRVESITQAKKTSPSWYLGQAAQFQEACDRLERTHQNLANEDVLPILRDKVNHLRVRATMPAPRVRRLGPIIREILHWRYHRYSRGLLSAAKDLLA